MNSRGYPSEWLYQLKQKNDIVSVISRYIRLDKKGKKYWGCCPFHNEKTPSFSVSEEEGLFYCFGCKESGDVITFVQKMESCDFSDAVKILANLAHMEVPEFTGDKDFAEKKKTKDRMLKLLDATYQHYNENLSLKEAKPAQEYIKLRGFTRKELEDFQLGYSLGWTEIVEYLRKQGFTYKEIVDAGVCQSKNGRYYDALSERLVFPIFNAFDECVGFSARAIGKVDFAKYLNTSDTLVFQKGRVVFGINLLKKLKKEKGLDKIIIVEGQIDVIAMHRAGFKNAVAILGSALTRENAHELKKMSNNIVLCFDGDEAGIKATTRSIEILREEGGFAISVVRLPDKQDPDEVIKARGREFMQSLIDNALPVVDYLIEIAKEKYDLSKPDQKGKFVKDAISVLQKLDSFAEAEAYLPKLRDITSMPIDVLRRDLNQNSAQKNAKAETAGKDKEKEPENVLTSRQNGNIRAMKYILSSLIYGKDYVDKRIDYKKLLPSFEKVIEKAEERLAVSSYFDVFDVEAMPVLKDCLVFDFTEYEKFAKRYFDECVWMLADGVLKDKQARLNEEFRTSESLDERREILKKLTEVAKQLREKSLEEFYGK